MGYRAVGYPNSVINVAAELPACRLFGAVEDAVDYSCIQRMLPPLYYVHSLSTGQVATVRRRGCWARCAPTRR